MALFRSQKMGFYTLLAPSEFAWEVLNELGDLDALQFLDLNAQETCFKRPYANHIKRCEDLEVQLTYIEDYMRKFNHEITQCEDYKEFQVNLKQALANKHQAERNHFNDVEREIIEKSQALTEQVKVYEDLIVAYNHLVAYREVLTRTKAYIGTVGHERDGPVSPQREIRFTNLAGVINTEDSLRFRRILFRITRGMVWTVLIIIENPTVSDYNKDGYFLDSTTNVNMKKKTVFLIVYQTGEQHVLKDRLNRVCESFGASKYGIPEDPIGFNNKLNEIEVQLQDSRQVLSVTKDRLNAILSYFAAPFDEKRGYSHIDGLKLFLIREKALYNNLNMLQVQTSLVKGYCWCPVELVDAVRENLTKVSTTYDIANCEFSETPVPAGISPPTTFKTNDVTGVFQEIVNTYGVPRYREINPGLFTIATFPFLFGVMFGDIAHGGLLLVAGLYLIFWKSSIEKDKESLWNKVLSARYLLALQGFFALYCGLIYNDFTSIPFNLFGTCYRENLAGTEDRALKCTYPFGLDPSWYGTTNELSFINSFKMKLAIVLGVTHMMFGIILRGLNSIQNRKWLDFFFEFIPMFLFMGVTFGYMVFLIFLKWALPWGSDAYPIESAPSIIGIFIKMALSPGHWDITLGRPLYGEDGTVQAQVQLVFLFTAIICALLILIPKPVILWAQNRKKSSVTVRDYTLQNTDYNLTQNLLDRTDIDNDQIIIHSQPEKQKQLVEKLEEGQPRIPGEEHFDMGEILVHQVIETIEFVLGSISNTASYLRLWALSLAHSQLSKVFFTNTVSYAMTGGNFIAAFIGFWIFANISLGVLMLMDQLECFLHALRLHWVEFQSKFYKADGYSFDPLSFERSIKKVRS